MTTRQVRLRVLELRGWHFCISLVSFPRTRFRAGIDFARHGEISIFTARLIPGVRHVISFPAGLARMNVAKFCLLTGAGGGLWMTTLMLVGYFIGGNKDLVHAYMPYITGAFITGVIGMVAFYIWQHRRKAVANVGN